MGEEVKNAVKALTEWIEKKGGYDIKINWTATYCTEVRISASYKQKNGEWMQTIEAVYSVENPETKKPVVKHEYTTSFYETNGDRNVKWV